MHEEELFFENNQLGDEIYSKEAVENLLEEDVISPEEEAFMHGYLSEGSKGIV